MKLKSLHIENYGKFSGYDYAFMDGVNAFCEQNGFGKTTLASFIKAMFYGLPSYRTNSKDFNDRIHFYPFNRGKFGGSITFEMDGKEYRIERYFDRRSETADTLNVFCCNALYNGFGGDVGKSVFGLDRESFERTVFIDSSAVDFGATGSISAKLNNYVDGSSGENSFAAAIERLERAKKDLKLTRGDGGKIPQTRRDIAELNGKIANVKAISATLEGKYRELNAVNADISAAEERKAIEEKRNLIAEQWKTYDSYIAEADRRGDELARLNEAYPVGILQKQEIAEFKRLSIELEKIKGAGSSQLWNEDKQARLDGLKEKFSGGVPAEQALSSTDNKISRAAALQNEIAIKSKESADGGFDGKFKNGTPDEDKLAVCTKNFTRMREIDDALNIRSEAAPVQKKNSIIPYIGCAAVALVWVILGIVCLLLVNTIIGGIIMGLGVLLFILSFVIYAARHNGGKTASVPNGDVISLQTEKKSLEREIYSVIAPFGYYSDRGVQYDYLELTGDLQKYNDNKEKGEKYDRELKEKSTELDTLRSDITGFFKNYGLCGDNFMQNSRQLHSDMAEFNRLADEQKAAEKSRRDAESEYNKNINQLEKIAGKYGIVCSENPLLLADRLLSDREKFDRLTGEEGTWRNKAESFKTENGLTTRPERGAETADTGAEIAAYRRRAAVLENEISEAESHVEKLDSLNAAMEDKQELLSAFQRKYYLLYGAAKMLKQAEQNLKDRYISPVKDRFVCYSKLIEEALGEKVVMDQNFNIMFERGGENRNDRHLSAGQRSICALCFRLALIDNMYKDETPFLVMDDPFINIDEAHLEKTLGLVKALSRGKQIIYFCCHPSRKID